ncbi:MAG: ABC transporter ATP-binding protein [Clostridiaceae bacterium]|nr:ABC transporter ATP-binding protein [Clostridiaceae bacterium]
MRIKNLSWSYGKERILDDINITFFKSGLYGIIGPNGSGKTTLLKSISRSLMPKENVVFLGDRDITVFSNKELARNIAYVPQDIYFEFEFSVMDIVLMGRSPYLKRFHSESEYDMETAKNAMQITNTWHLREKNIAEISGGERQRVIIARALAQGTGIMLMDEPVSQLDIQHQVEILGIIKRLTEDKGMIAILSLHDLNLASQYCDHLILLSKGRVLKQGSPQEIITEGNISKVYNTKVHIFENPFTGRPYIIPFSN